MGYLLLGLLAIVLVMVLVPTIASYRYYKAHGQQD